MALWDKFLHSGENPEEKAKMLWARAQKYFEGKLYNRALKDLSDAITLQPSLVKEAVELMQAFMSQGNNEQALSVGLAMLKMDPKNYELMNRLGNALRKMGSFSKASKLYTMALKINPKFSEGRYNLAACSFGITVSDGELIRNTRAVEAYVEYRRYGFLGDRVDFYEIPNQVLEKAEDKKGKGKEEPEAEEEEPIDEEALAQMIDTMARQLKEDIAATQGAWEAEYNLGLFYDLVNMGELSLKHYQTALEHAHDNVQVNNNMAVALCVHKNNLEQAETILLQNLRTHRYDRTTVLNLAAIYKKQAKQFQILKYYVYLGDLLAKSLGEFDTVKVEAHAQDLFQRRKYIEAIPFFENLAKEKQEDFWFEKLAVMFFNQKKEDLYIKTLKDLLKVNPSHSDARDKIKTAAQEYEDQARQKMDKGSKRQAIQLFEKAVKIEETAERWVELTQLYHDEGEEILADFAMKKWKTLSGHEPVKEEGAAQEAGE